MSKFNVSRRFGKDFFIVVTVILMLLPALVLVSDSMTKLVELSFLYKFIQKYIVGYEIRTVAAVLTFLKFPIMIQENGININNTFLQVTWNCLGWQSLLFLFFSFMAGFQNSFTKSSVAEAVLIGLLGTYLINTARMIFIVILGGYFQTLFLVVFHDYLAVFITVIWLFVYWWFCYRFVFEEK